MKTGAKEMNNRIRKFMEGRYGGDHLSTALLILSVILTFTGSIANIPALTLLSYIPLFVVFFRMFSRNIVKRQRENYKFFMLMRPVYMYYIKLKNKLKDSKTHRIFKCPDCKAKLRVPKGKGKIAITCSVCRKEFVKKT